MIFCLRCSEEADQRKLAAQVVAQGRRRGERFVPGDLLQTKRGRQRVEALAHAYAGPVAVAAAFTLATTCSMRGSSRTAARLGLMRAAAFI